MRKPQGNGRLKTLPAERQAEIAEYLKSHTYPETIAWLRDQGVVTSSKPLWKFRSWHLLRQQFLEDQSTTETLLEQLKKEAPSLTDKQLDDLGQRTFGLLAIRRQDLHGFVKVRSARAKAELEKEKLKLRQQEVHRLQERLELQRKKFQRDTCALFLEWLEDKRANEIAAEPGSNAEKIERLGKLMFGADWK